MYALFVLFFPLFFLIIFESGSLRKCLWISLRIHAVPGFSLPLTSLGLWLHGADSQTESFLLCTSLTDSPGSTKWYQPLQKERTSRLPGKGDPGLCVTYDGALASTQLVGSLQGINKKQQIRGSTNFRLLSASWNSPKPQGSRQPLYICVSLSGFISFFSVCWNAEIFLLALLVR